MSYENTLPDIDTAANVIFERVHADAFFAKLAEYGHVPQNQDEALALLELSGQLATIEQDQTKQASAGPYTTALSSLGLALNAQGHNPIAERNKVASAQSRAVALMHDPDVYVSAAAIKLAEASAVGN